MGVAQQSSEKTPRHDVKKIAGRMRLVQLQIVMGDAEKEINRVHVIRLATHEGNASEKHKQDYQPRVKPSRAGSCMEHPRIPKHPGSRIVCLSGTRQFQRLNPLVIGKRRSRPKAREVILTPGGAWRRLYSARSTMRMTRRTVASSKPRATISGMPSMRSM